MNAVIGTSCLASVGVDQRRYMFDPPKSWNISRRKSYVLPAVSFTGALVCSRSQSGSQWSMTGSPSM